MSSSTKVLLTGLLVLVLAAFCLASDKLVPGQQVSFATRTHTISWSPAVEPFTLRSLRVTYPNGPISNRLTVTSVRSGIPYRLLDVSSTGAWQTCTWVIPGDLSINPRQQDVLVLSNSIVTNCSVILDARHDDLQ